MERERQGRTPQEDGGRNWSEAATSQGQPGVSSSHQPLGEEREDVPLQSLEGKWSCRHLELECLASKIVKEQISVVLRCEVYGDLLCQSQESNLTGDQSGSTH